VQRLEREFSTRLFYRNGRGVQLTEAGTKLQRVGKEIFQSLDSLKEELTDDNSRFRGVVTLGLPPSLGATVSTGLVRRFQQTYPEARIKVLVAFSGTLTEWLEAGRIDVGVLYDVRRSATLLVAPLLLEPLYLVESASTSTASRGKTVRVAPSSRSLRRGRSLSPLPRTACAESSTPQPRASTSR